MVDNSSKPRSVQITNPGYVKDRTNDLRIKKDDAQRLIARYLRDANMSPTAANNLSNRICDGIIANMSSAGRPALRGFRMVSKNPPEDIAGKVASAFRSINSQETHDWSLARDVWNVVYNHGQALPDDVVI